MKFRWLTCCTLVLCALLFSVSARAEGDADPSNTVYMDLKDGRVVIQLHPELAPKTVARFKELVRQGFYDGLTWHRVIDGFMAQTGDPRGDGSGGSGLALNAEFNSGRHARGALSMARLPYNINTADSQFFIVLKDSPFLDGQYTYFGQVTSGMEFVDRIRKGDSNNNGTVTNPDRILHMRLARDVKKADAPPDSGSMAKVPGMAANFDASNLICSSFVAGVGAADSSGALTSLGRLWTEGYLAGFAKAGNQLQFSADAGVEDALSKLLLDKCRAFPKASIQSVVAQGLAADVHVLPAAPADNFVPASLTCGEYVDARGKDHARAELAELWAFAFIEGYKSRTQPGLAILPENKPALNEAIARNCAGNRDMSFLNLTAVVADRVKLESGRHK